QVLPPSENTAISRCFLVETTYNCSIKFTAPLNSYIDGFEPFQWGHNVATQAFPFNQSISTAKLSINGHSNSVSVQDVLPQLLRLMNTDELQQFNGATPCLVDKFRSYMDAQISNSSPLSGIDKLTFDSYLVPRGIHPIDTITYVHTGDVANNGEWAYATT